MRSVVVVTQLEDSLVVILETVVMVVDRAGGWLQDTKVAGVRLALMLGAQVIPSHR